jgi:hypothetical protein
MKAYKESSCRTYLIGKFCEVDTIRLVNMLDSPIVVLERDRDQVLHFFGRDERLELLQCSEVFHIVLDKVTEANLDCSH